MTANSIASTKFADSYTELRALWPQEEQRRADGGWWSLSGFSIQATIALDRFIRRALIDGASDAFAFEVLSDFSEVGDKTNLVQVKRTLTRKTLAAAVGEARIILNLCSPTYAGKVQFQIVCERDEAGLKLSDLTPAEVFDDPGAVATDLQKVLARFNPTTPIKVMSNPGLSLRRTLLSVGVRDPDRVARDALGTLFDAFDGANREGIESALMRAISDIRSRARPEDAVPGRLLAPDMFKRHADGNTTLFGRARPRLSDLVGERFLERRDALRPLVDTAEAWLSGLDRSYADDDLRLPVLWLEGRPGDGKSVLTLQLLEYLIATSARLSSVTELANAGELSAWMTSAARRNMGNQAEIGFIDDLSAHIDQTGLEALIDGAFYRGSPYIGLITCGTSEDGDSFAKRSRITLTPAKIRAPNVVDLEALRSWAEARLGRPLPGSIPDGASISEFMAGLTLGDGQHQPLAKRGMSVNLKAAMAVSALGLTAPPSMVSHADILAYAAERPDIELLPMEEASGVRLGHAGVTWRLYVDIAGETELLQSWGADLGRVLAIRLADGQATEAKTLLGALTNTPKAINQLRRLGVQAQGTALLDSAYRAFTKGCPSPAGAPLFRQWLAAATSRRLTEIGVPALRDEGRQLLAVDGILADVKAEVASSLIQVGRFDDVARRAAGSFLRRVGPVPAAARYAINVLSKSFEGHAAEVAIAWLIKNREKPEIGEVLGRVLNNKAPPKLKELAFAYLKRFIAHPNSGAVLGAFAAFDKTKRLYHLQDLWLAQTTDAPRALGIYRDQLQTGHWRRFAGRALAFMQAHPEIYGGQEILSHLIRKRSVDPDVLIAARAWLNYYVGEGVATPVLIDLITVQPLDADDLERALQHLHRGAIGASLLFATLAVILQALSPSERRGLRSRLPKVLVSGFDQATFWNIQNLDGHLKQLDERLRNRS